MASASFRSVVEMFHHRIRSTPDSDAMYYKVGGTWTPILWRDVGRRARNIACGLRGLGLQDSERCAILSGTRMEWVLCDMGILCASGATTTVYPSNTAPECVFILNDSQSRYVFVENQKQLEKLLQVRAEIPTVRNLVLLDGAAPGGDGYVVTLADLEARGEAWDKANPGVYDTVSGAVGPDSLATLIYTSGTTGQPKGVCLTHDCWVYEGEAIDTIGLMTPADKQLLWLPLAHSFAKVLEIAFIRIGVPTAIDGDIDALRDNLAATQPTVVAAVPRVFEKVYNGIIAAPKEAGGLKLAIFNWAMGVGRAVSQLRQAGKQPTGFLALKYSLADKLVFSKVKARFGGRIRFFVSGGAPLSREIAEFLHAADMLVLEGYGLTETSAASFVNRPDNFKFGTVGPPLPGTEVRIAEDGEILIRGRGVMHGYFQREDATKEALDPDGWLHTGDIGEMADGLLKITDRKKDLIKTSGGKYIAPQELEGALKLASPLVAQVVIHGDNRNFVSALVTLNDEAARKFAEQKSITFSSTADLTTKPELVAEVKRAVDAVNTTLPSYSTIKKFGVLPKELTVEDGFLTPKMSIKRKEVERRYKEMLDGFYAGAGGSGL
jgi:long-chain acyl-CoA synthetase